MFVKNIIVSGQLVLKLYELQNYKKKLLEATKVKELRTL